MTKILFCLMLVCCMIAPVYQSFAQQTYTSDNTFEQLDVAEKNEIKDKKKSKKEKDDIEINTKFFISLLINIATMAFITLFIYYPLNRRIETIFTFFMFNLMIFLLTFVLNKIKISMGAAFGLFAVFSMLRYRTESISMKDMTYLFIFIAVGLISAIQLEYHELGIICAVVIISTFLLDSKLILKRELSKRIDYENIEFIKPEYRKQLIDDLQNRTGLKIHRVYIQKIDFLRDAADIKIYYYEE